ncbi:hypothetical protein AGR2A_Cc30077 [Agrobacterium genomosp. 2 str. CFBP 5494]|uniref:Uncharacterized protein n=1 Tax=Agrobacterium genomosp. 2 str. CFBP 5494 TaxID=1183436 RepID=A0A9W5F0I4_9HYPH|nr:hypothetical protein AGR2A_Cc30077 [Agrobacterium genomosp. 2 str. CFBP 5494]
MAGSRANQEANASDMSMGPGNDGATAEGMPFFYGSPPVIVGVDPRPDPIAGAYSLRRTCLTFYLLVGR